ncbi:lipopolysaccharide export system protein LptA [Lewinella aquimaris]|uniref:Lipopolysaccharide export system protein LptA n=1 Tax=Neolewinella aquimaris TaxID=1835722 RepID=A0A840DYS3_9BACT|nr:OstA-like protein [Neolewinella aquimaris]MBB4078414.1 lipopolysaccharide export system protein LptA [Neolewinella aquimaris]
MHHPSFLVVALLCLLPVVGWSQEAPAPEKQVVSIDHANELRMLQRASVQRLIGEVELSQDSIFMYCDSAELVSEVQLYAYDNVVVQQGDSIAAFAQYLDYNAETLLAKLRNEVVLKRGQTELFTDRLDYNLATKLATYHTGGRVTNAGTELSSTHGYYYADNRNVYFRDSVLVVDERFEMRADTLRYDLANERVYFLGPTVIRSDTHNIYCESGYYDVALDEAVFRTNAQYRSGERLAAADSIQYFGNRQLYVLEGDAYVAEGKFQRATAERINYFRAEDRYQLAGNATVIDSAQTVSGDSIDYNAVTASYAVSGGRPSVSNPPMIMTADRMYSDEVSGLGRAVGNIVWEDTTAKLKIEADEARYDQSTGYLKASGGRNGRALLTTFLDQDTLFMAADTLLSVRSDDVDAQGDTVRYLSAYPDVRILKSDLQAVADSLGFNTVDSVLTLYQNPVLWQDTSQLTADTIDLYLRNEQPDRVHLRRNAMVITSPDLIFYNQVKGKDIVAHFDSSQLKRTEVKGNAEAIYYAQDDQGAYIGVNKTACSMMVLYFARGGVERIKFLSAPSGRLDPMDAVNHEGYRLDGFRWEDRRRPRRFEDLFARPPELQ